MENNIDGAVNAAANQDINAVAEQLLMAQKVSPEEATQILIQYGYPENLANDAVNNILEQFLTMRDDALDKIKSHIFWGFVFAGGGAILTGLDLGYVFIGAIAYGIWSMLQGVYYYFKLSSSFSNIY